MAVEAHGAQVRAAAKLRPPAVRSSSWHDPAMDESRAAARKVLADAAHRRSDDDVSDLLRNLAVAPEQGAAEDDLDDLVRRAQAGDLRAREEVIGRLLPLVNSIARGYRTAGLERADLVQEGCVGILRGLRRFDPDRGVPFSVYAALWVRQALQELRSDFIRPLRLPPKALRQLAQLKSEHYRIYADEHRDASLAELAPRRPARASSLNRPVRGGARQHRRPTAPCVARPPDRTRTRDRRLPLRLRAARGEANGNRLPARDQRRTGSGRSRSARLRR